MTTTRDKIGEAIRAAREAAGLTQVAAAERAGLQQPDWSDYETGAQQPRIETLRRIAAALGVEPGSLI